MRRGEGRGQKTEDGGKAFGKYVKRDDNTARGQTHNKQETHCRHISGAKLAANLRGQGGLGGSVMLVCVCMCVAG